eukprot:jgi/Mesvir1/28520/Mv04262-RA.1
MSATIIITETGVKEEMGRTLDTALDNNVNYPVTEDQLRAYVALGGRLDPSVESMRLKGGIHVANLNRAITTDERYTAPYQHMFWDSMKRTDSHGPAGPRDRRSVVRDLPDGYQAFPSFTSSRGGYGAEPPDYTTGPLMKPTMGYGRNTSAIKLHADPPRGYVPSYSTFENISTAPIRAGATSKVPGPEPWTSKPVATVAEMTGLAAPDRIFGMHEEQIMVRKPNPQQAHLENRFVVLDPTNRANRSGLEDRPPGTGNESNVRRNDAGILQMSVLPERSLPLSTMDAVHDSGGQRSGVRYADPSFTRVDARRFAVIENSHTGPKENALFTPLTMGQHMAVMRPPANERTRENLVSNADGERLGTATHVNPDLHVHTRTSETKVFQNIPTYADSSEGRLMGEDFMLTTRLRDITDEQIHAVRGATEQATNTILEERGWVEGFRVERPAKIGTADVEVEVGEKSAEIAYAALASNSEYIKNVNQVLEETSGLAYLYGAD